MAFRIPGETAGEARFRQRMARAQQAQETHEKRRLEMIGRQIAAREMHEKAKKRHAREMFDLYLLADRVLDLLEETRDRNAPKGTEEDWNDRFCGAVEAIPEVKRFMAEMSVEMNECGKG